MEITRNDDTVCGVDEYLEGVKKLRIFQGPTDEGSLEYYAKQYARLAKWKNLLFRLTGSFVILLSVSLPIVAAFGGALPHKDLWVSVIAGAIALCSGLNSFFRWDAGWRGCLEAQRKLVQLRDEWDYKIERARTYPDSVRGFQIAKEATANLVNAAHEIILSETKQYLDAQKFPDAGSTRER
jgi:hypothetical protein